MAALPEPRVTVQSLVDQWHEDHQESPRSHMGASTLGHPCDRWLWLSFRWAVIEKFSGRILRLFRRGQREEETIVHDLRAIGIDIHSTCFDNGQSRVDFGCHVSGSIDGIIESGVPEAPKTRHIAEFKTHGAKSFKELQTKGIKEAKRQHWCQMQMYMAGTDIKRALYVAINKDTDEMYTERVNFDEGAAQALIARGHRLALTERMPEPLTANPSWWQCKFCAAHDFCHGSRVAREVNCRTCAHVTPTKEGKWLCSVCANKELSYTEQLAGCPSHVIHPDLVPWQWQGGTDDELCAKYVIDGRVVLNGEATDQVYSSRELLGLEPVADRAKPVKVPF